MKIILYLFLSFFIFNIQVRASSIISLSQNDVSILIPLPAPAQVDLLFHPMTNGKFGALLPKLAYDKLPEINPFTNKDLTYSELRVISIRIDPCFPLTPPAVGCQPQIRFIWQPLKLTTSGKLSAFDATVHTSYNLEKSEFALVIQKLKQLKKETGLTTTDEPLSVNPVLLKKGLNSLYAKNLFNMLLSFSGEQKLSRITFMQLSASANIWTFGGFDLIGGAMQALQIPRINNISQAFSNSVITEPTPNFFKGDIFPAPQGIDTFNLLIRDSSVIAPTDKDEIIESTLSAVRIENPLNHNPHTVDCVSCHTAQAAKLWAIRQYPWLWLDLRSSDLTFHSKFNLNNTSANPEKTTSLRAFGYDGVEPAISQRVINETAKVLESLER